MSDQADTLVEFQIQGLASAAESMRQLLMALHDGNWFFVQEEAAYLVRDLARAERDVECLLEDAESGRVETAAEGIRPTGGAS